MVFKKKFGGRRVRLEEISSRKLSLWSLLWARIPLRPPLFTFAREVRGRPAREVRPTGLDLSILATPRIDFGRFRPGQVGDLGHFSPTLRFSLGYYRLCFRVILPIRFNPTRRPDLAPARTVWVGPCC